MDKTLLIIIMTIMIPCYLSDSRLGYDRLNLYTDSSGQNWMYFSSNWTLIFDNLYMSTSGFNLYFPFMLLEASDIAKFTLILKNENTIIVNNVGDLTGANAFEFRGRLENNFTIQGDGKLTINYDSGKNDMLSGKGFFVLYSNLVIKENAKIEIIMSNARELTGLEVFDGRLNMEGNSQICVLLKNCLRLSYGIKSEATYLSGSVTINSSLPNLDSSSQDPVLRWFYGYGVSLRDYSNVTFVTNGTLDLPDSFFSYIGKEPKIINAIESLEEFLKSHKLTQKDKNESIIFSNYFTIRESKQNSQVLRISFLILLILLI